MKLNQTSSWERISYDHFCCCAFVSNLLKSAREVFDPALIPPLVGVLSLVLSRAIGGSAQRQALVALTNRNSTTMDTFVASVKGKILSYLKLYFRSMISDAGLEIVELSSPILESCDVFVRGERVHLFRITT
jgi:hypothetical protein